MIMQLPAISLGYLRRPEHDGEGMWAWEAPDGKIYYYNVDEMPMIAVIRPRREP